MLSQSCVLGPQPAYDLLQAGDCDAAESFAYKNFRSHFLTYIEGNVALCRGQLSQARLKYEMAALQGQQTEYYPILAQAHAQAFEQAWVKEALLVPREYIIDGLVVTHLHDGAAKCSRGGVYSIDISGAIGPDSGFALEELLKRSPHCLDQDGSIIRRTRVTLRSGGGLLNDGYMMGRLFRKEGIETHVSTGGTCASSCAVAYLGGLERIVSNNASIIFHSPYLLGLNALGEQVANCDIGEVSSQELLKYYQEMTNEEQGQRLMARTLSYCSTTEGWVLTGPSAAELFGVATQAEAYR